MTGVTGKSGHLLARFVLTVFLLLAGGLPLGIQGCASNGGNAPRSGAGSGPPPVAIDAMLPSGDGWRAFRLGALRHAKLTGDPATGIHPPPISGSEWLTLAAPSGPFRPVQVIPAQFGYFLLVDAASSRLCLYDSAASLIATTPLPEEFTPFPAGRVSVFRAADGAFTFVDYAAGGAWQFADRQTSGAGKTQWIPRGQVKLPAGLRDCMQPPGSAEMFCRGGDGAPLRFDGALNRLPVRATPDGSREGARAVAVWIAGGGADPGAWAIEGRTAGGVALFRFLPARRQWITVPPPGAP